jgi:hypothetical protein
MIFSEEDNTELLLLKNSHEVMSRAMKNLKRCQKTYKELMKSTIDSLKSYMREIYMHTDDDIMDQVRHCAQEFVKKRYPDEVPYFNIAWKTFTNALNRSNRMAQGKRPTIKDLRGPTLRNLKGPTKLGDDSIMAPRIIHAFHLLFTMAQTVESENNESLKQEMLQFLSQKKFSLEFSMEIITFFMENQDNW